MLAAAAEVKGLVGVSVVGMEAALATETAGNRVASLVADWEAVSAEKVVRGRVATMEAALAEAAVAVMVDLKGVTREAN